MIKPGRDADGQAQTEADYFEKCPGCGQWVDGRDLSQVIEHIHDAWDEIEEIAPIPRSTTLPEMQEEFRRFAAETGDSKVSRILYEAADQLELVRPKPVQTRH